MSGRFAVVKRKNYPFCKSALMCKLIFLFCRQVNVINYQTRPNAKDFIQVEIVVEKNTQKIILIGKACELYLYYCFCSVSISLSCDLLNFILQSQLCSNWILVFSWPLIWFNQDGKALKLLATASRLDIEDFLQKKVFLEVSPWWILGLQHNWFIVSCPLW